MEATEGIEPRSGLWRRAIRWTFASRRSGRLTVAQWPNVWLWIFIILTVGLRLFPTKGSDGHLTRVFADVALLIWAADELVRGVNPFRRMVGSLVIFLTIYSLTR